MIANTIEECCKRSGETCHPDKPLLRVNERPVCPKGCGICARVRREDASISPRLKALLLKH